MGKKHPKMKKNKVSLFERDNWICQICLKKIDKEKKYPNPLSVSIDHIIPLSKGGLNIRRNTQLAHLSCNINLRAKDIKQLRIF